MTRAWLVLALCVPHVALAQIRGTVRDEAGAPVAEAMVELLAPGGRLAVTATDASGGFVFLPHPAAAAVLVRRVGFAPARVTLGSSGQPLAIVLERRSLPVSGLTVMAPPPPCVDRDRPDARRLWEQAARRYASGALMAGLAADRMSGRAIVPPDSFGVLDTARLARGFTSMAGVGLRPRADQRERFYAQPPLIGSERSFRWSYPHLESVQAWHFADVLFGELNRLALAPREVGELIILFCGSAPGRPHITGRIHLAPDTTFLKAEWRYVPTEANEQAGGEVVFMPRSPGAPLLAASGFFWRAVGGGFFQEWASYVQWYECGVGGCGERRPLR